MSDPIAELKRELLAAAERQHVRTLVPAPRRRFGGRVGATRLLPIAAAVAVAAAAALLFSAPWSDSPSFLARAQAALTPPKGMILHEKWVETATWTYRKCTVSWTAEYWMDQAYSELVGGRRFRALLHQPLPYPFMPIDIDHTSLVCSPGRAYEVGGYGGLVLRFAPPNRLVRLPVSFGGQSDPVGDLRRAIRAGHAYDEGTTTRHGRTVQRIRISDCPPSNSVCPDGPAYAYAYVDPDTFYPVEIDDPGVSYTPGYTPDRLVAANPRTVTRFLAFEYLPRTSANLALTDIRAQHPHATEP